MKESDLYIPVRDWLRSRGFTVHIEVFEADVVGMDANGRLAVVELKIGITNGLFIQLGRRALWADEVWGAVPPVSTQLGSGWNYHGYGLLVVDYGRVRIKRGAKPQPWHWHRTRAYRRKTLLGRNPAADHHLAGLPSCGTAKIQRAESRSLRATA